MTILGVIVILTVLGFLAYLSDRFIMDGSIKSVAKVFLLIVAVVVVLNALGLFGIVNQPVPQVR